MKQRRRAASRSNTLLDRRWKPIIEAAADLTDLWENRFFNRRATRARGGTSSGMRLRDANRLPAWAIALQKLLATVESRSNQRIKATSARGAKKHLRFLPLCIPAVEYFTTQFTAQCPPKL